MTVSPVGPRAHWLPPRELYRWLKSPYQADLESVFLPPLARIISQYANYNLGKNSTNWYKALINLGVVPDRIPPLPINIHEILNRDCPMHRNIPNFDKSHKKIHETHFLCLIPAGKIDTLAKRKFGAGHANPYLSVFHNDSFLHDPDMTSFNEPEWVLIGAVEIPTSTNASYKDQVWMIQDLREHTDINYEIPSFKHTLAANLLYAAAEKKGLWDSLPIRVAERNLVIVDPYSTDSLETGVDQVSRNYLSHDLGITVLWKITKPSPKPFASSCSVS